MKIEYLDKIPAIRNRHFKLQTMLDEFDRTDKNVMKITYADGEYSTPQTCRNTMKQAIRRSGRRWSAHVIDGEVYIIKDLGK